MFCETPPTSKCMRSTDGSPSLPYSFEGNNLKTIQVAADGSYTDEHGIGYLDEQGRKQKVVTTIIEVVASMVIGQKLMIVQRKEDDYLKQNQEEDQTEGNI